MLQVGMLSRMLHPMVQRRVGVGGAAANGPLGGRAHCWPHRTLIGDVVPRTVAMILNLLRVQVPNGCCLLLLLLLLLVIVLLLLKQVLLLLLLTSYPAGVQVEVVPRGIVHMVVMTRCCSWHVDAPAGADGSLAVVVVRVDCRFFGAETGDLGSLNLNGRNRWPGHTYSNRIQIM